MMIHEHQRLLSPSLCSSPDIRSLMVSTVHILLTIVFLTPMTESGTY